MIVTVTADTARLATSQSVGVHSQPLAPQSKDATVWHKMTWLNEAPKCLHRLYFSLILEENDERSWDGHRSGIGD